MSRKWTIWSKDPSRNAWLAVEANMSEKMARDGVERRMATAKRHGLTAEFVALPWGEMPPVSSVPSRQQILEGGSQGRQDGDHVG
jgi:hypothetical protein